MPPTLSADEIAALDSLLQRARADKAAGEPTDSLIPGDVVQLRPDIDRTWETSLLLVMKVDGLRVRGQVLRPHRSGCPEAWYQFKPGEAVRIGHVRFDQPAPDVRAWCYDPPCPLQQRRPPARAGAPSPSFREAQAVTRDHRAAVAEALTAEAVEVQMRQARQERQRALRRHGKLLKQGA